MPMENICLLSLFSDGFYYICHIGGDKWHSNMGMGDMVTPVHMGIEILYLCIMGGNELLSEYSKKLPGVMEYDIPYASSILMEIRDM